MPIPITSEPGLKARGHQREGISLKVLVIADDRQVIRDITFCLQIRYPEVTVVSVGDGTRGIGMMETESPHLAVVDSSLPGTDILDLVGAIRACAEVPLFVLYEEATDVDRAKWLEAGADDCVARPFSPLELVSKVKVALRRSQGVAFKPEQVLSIGGRLTINFATHEVLLSGKRLHLTPIEYRLLSELATNQGRVLSYTHILDKVWGPEYVGDPGLVKGYIYHLRKKLRNSPGNPQMIQTELGMGYRFIASD